MEPINFPEANGTHNAPAGMNEEQCGPAPSWTGEYEDGTPVVICCWQPTDDELTEILAEGLIYVGFIGGGVFPHVVYPGNPFGRKYEKGSLALKLLEEQKHKQALQKCLNTINSHEQHRPTSIPSLASYQANTLQEVKTLLEQALGESQ